MNTVLVFLSGFALAAGLSYLFLYKELHRLRDENQVLQASAQEQRQQEIRLEEKLRSVTEAQALLIERFGAVSQQALQSNNQTFLDLAKTAFEKLRQESQGDLQSRQQAIESMVKPVQESLQRVDQKIQDLEKSRVGAYEGIKQQVQSLLEVQNRLRDETGNLVKALRSPIVRGRWGEIQLKRVVEMAGMLEHCDFYEQSSREGDDGKRLRPDMVVRLPGGKQIIVDAKAPLSAYLEAIEATTEEARILRLKHHALQIREHMTLLSRKSYWDQFQPSPEFVVLFLPGEAFFSAALEQDPALIEMGVEQRVILATPTTLIALLRAVAYGWRQESITQNAELISQLGRELYKRVVDLSDHLSRVGKGLGHAVESYNRAIGSYESRVLVSARRFQELDPMASKEELGPLAGVETVTRELTPQQPV